MRRSGRRALCVCGGRQSDARRPLLAFPSRPVQFRELRVRSRMRSPIGVAPRDSEPAQPNGEELTGILAEFTRCGRS